MDVIDGHTKTGIEQQFVYLNFVFGIKLNNKTMKLEI